MSNHMLFPLYDAIKKFNEMNIKIAEKIIERNGLSVSGFVAPEYFWYNNIADIFEKEIIKILILWDLTIQIIHIIQ